MKLNEKFDDTENNLFELMTKIHPFPWVSYDFINTYWLGKYGELTLNPAFEETNVGVLANMVSSIVAEKWDIQYANYHLNLLVDGNKSETVTHNITDTSENKTDVQGENGHNVSAFDSTELVTDSNDTVDTVTNNVGNSTRAETTVTNARTGNFITDMISYNKYLTNIGFYDMIISDVNKCLAFGSRELDY